MFDVLFLQTSIINWVSIKQLQMIWLNVTPCPKGHLSLWHLSQQWLKIVGLLYFVYDDICINPELFCVEEKSRLYMTSWYPKHWYDGMCLLLALCVKHRTCMRKLFLCRKEEVGTFIPAFALAHLHHSQNYVLRDNCRHHHHVHENTYVLIIFSIWLKQAQLI